MAGEPPYGAFWQWIPHSYGNPFTYQPFITTGTLSFDKKEAMSNDLVKLDVEGAELWREYDIPGRDKPYRIDNPVAVYFRKGGSTQRVVDSTGIVHSVPGPGYRGCVVRWEAVDSSEPVKF